MDTSRSLRLISVAALLAVMAALLATGLAPARSHAQAAPYQMAVDTDPGTAGVQSTININGTSNFTVGLNVTAAAAAYQGYQWEIEFNPAGLAFVSATENSGTTGFASCPGTSDNSGSALNPGDVAEIGGCVSTGAASSFVGQTTVLTLHCASSGTFNLMLLDLNQEGGFGSAALAFGGSSLTTSTAGATITCAGAGAAPTDTPAPPATDTPIPAATSTPMATSTPCTSDCPTATDTPAAAATSTEFPSAFTRTPAPTNTSVPPTTAAGGGASSAPPPSGSAPLTSAPASSLSGVQGSSNAPIRLPNTGTAGSGHGNNWRNILELGGLALVAAAGATFVMQRRQRG